ncbi:MAG: hypothetical protein LH470_02275 [Lysobacter sp.]|nr:hypothetical protein [Lysobacter sp.]
MNRFDVARNPWAGHQSVGQRSQFPSAAAYLHWRCSVILDQPGTVVRAQGDNA